MNYEYRKLTFARNLESEIRDAIAIGAGNANKRSQGSSSLRPFHGGTHGR